MRSHTHGFYGKLVRQLCAVCPRVDPKNRVSNFQLMHPLRFYAWLTLEVLKIVRRPHKSINNFRTKRNIENRTRFFRSTLGIGHRVVPPTFHKIHVYAISFGRLGSFSKKS